jgi:uncharacterized protein (TIGR02145 family)
MSKDQKLKKWYCVAKITVVTITSGLPGGNRYLYNGNFYNVGDLGYWWSSTESSSTLAWYRLLYYNNGNASGSYDFKQNGLSVRCLRD